MSNSSDIPVFELKHCYTTAFLQGEHDFTHSWLQLILGPEWFTGTHTKNPQVTLLVVQLYLSEPQSTAANNEHNLNTAHCTKPLRAVRRYVI